MRDVFDISLTQYVTDMPEQWLVDYLVSLGFGENLAQQAPDEFFVNHYFLGKVKKGSCRMVMAVKLFIVKLCGEAIQRNRDLNYYNITTRASLVYALREVIHCSVNKANEIATFFRFPENPQQEQIAEGDMRFGDGRYHHFEHVYRMCIIKDLIEYFERAIRYKKFYHFHCPFVQFNGNRIDGYKSFRYKSYNFFALIRFESECDDVKFERYRSQRKKTALKEK